MPRIYDRDRTVPLRRAPRIVDDRLSFNQPPQAEVVQERGDGGSPRGRRPEQRGPAAVESSLGGVDSAGLGDHPGLGLLEQRVHLGEQRRRRGALALERLDPLESPQNRACFVHESNVAAAAIRVCAGSVSKGIRSVPTVAPQPDRDLGDARSAIDRGDGRRALKSLDRARRGYNKARDADGLEHVLDMAALVDTTEDRTRIGVENLAYAVKQNLRQESRRAAQQRGEPWVDPYPDLQAPTEHTGLVLTRRVKVLIGIGVLVATLLVAGAIVGLILVDTSSTTVTLRLVNDTRRPVTVRGCDDADCFTTWLDRDVGPGLETDADVDADSFVELFKLARRGPDLCLPVRVHDGYLLLDGGPGALAVRLSEASACPGATVLPEPAEQTPL
jgi:hypothetical protein